MGIYMARLPSGLWKVAMTAMLAASTAAVAQEANSLRALRAKYLCQVVDRLERIHAHGDPTSDRDRFIAVTVPQHRHGYVQCIFFDQRSQMLCEASSGFYYDKEGAPRTFFHPPEVPQALGRLGFSTDDTKGNYRMEFEVGARPDFNAIADLILRALHDGYGARAHTRLRFNAPFAQRPVKSCTPVS
jgi:hypothetical protein